MTRPAEQPQPTTGTLDSVETAFFADVDQANRNHRLLAAMDATACWPAVQELRAWTESAITRGDSVLDVGCGLADAAIAIAKNQSHIAVTGIDSSVEMLDAARQRAGELGADITFQQGDATSLPFDTATFGAVRCERVLQWLDQPEAAVQEMARVTAPGGTVALLDTDWRTFSTTVTDRDLEQRMAGPWSTPHAGAFLRQYARRAGLENIECKPVVHYSHHITGDASDGMFPFDQYLELQIERGRTWHDAEKYLDELARQSSEGSLTLAVTMWATIGTVPIQTSNR